MPKEWSEQNKYSSFNSWKGLLYREHYEAIIAETLLPPIEASLDPAAMCQLDCRWCGSYDFLNPRGGLYGGMAARMMPRGHLIELSRFLIDWGVRGCCLGGGGEPTLNPDCAETIRLWRARKREVAVVTNGVDLGEELLDIMPECRWVGLSVDAGSADEYERLKGRDAFWRVLGNIDRLVKRADGYCDISFKFLVVPENSASIFSACQMAKEIGVREFHVRPAKIERKAAFASQKVIWPHEIILEQFGRCHELEDDGFRVITSSHKFGPDFGIKNQFERCWASPLQIQCCADGGVYVCQDQRIEPRFRIGSHYPRPLDILKFWGWQEHLQLIRETRPGTECPNCTYGPYAEQIEQAVLRDSMCMNFP